jgi:hypothetical protein
LVKKGSVADQRLLAAEEAPQPLVDEVVEKMLESAEPAKKKGSKVTAPS